MTSIRYLFAFIIILTFPGRLHAFPDEERLPTSFSEPPLQALSDQPADFVVSSDNRFVFFASGNSLPILDLATWELASDQVPDLSAEEDNEDLADLAGTNNGVAVNDDQLFATQDDGDLLIIDLNNITAEPDVEKIATSSLGVMVADPGTGVGDDKLYIVDASNNQILVYDISDNSVTASIVLESAAVERTPDRLVFADANSGTDKVFVTTTDGLIFVIADGGNSADVLNDEGHDFAALAVDPTGAILYVLDNDDQTLRAFDTQAETELADATVPLDLSTANDDFRDLVVTDVSDPSDTYAYIAGGMGISVIDTNGNETNLSLEVVDMVAGGDDDDPLDLDGGRTANRVFSFADQYVLTVNGDASMSVITDNPFVTITEDSLEGASLGVGESFTLTFESDETGTYSVRVGGGLDASGVELDSGTVDTANSPITTAELNQGDGFAEGTNEVFVFVTDEEGNGNTGHDMREISVDTPPGLFTIISTDFGDEKIFINFSRLTDEDIVSYNLYADTDAEAVLTKDEVGGTVDQPSSGEVVTGTIEGLINGVLYFLAVEAVDESGNVSARVGQLADGSRASETPQALLGITGAAGEEGCQLLSQRHNGIAGTLFYWMGLASVILMLRRRFI